MKKNVILSAITFLFFQNLLAQELYNEDFEDFTLGNVGTDSSGQTEGQGGWYTYSHWTYMNSTPYNDLFQIENTTTNGKVIALLPHPYPYSSAGTYINKDLNTVITNRTLGNDVIKLEVDFYTGQQTNSENSAVNYGLSRTTGGSISNKEIIAGFSFDSTTGELKGIHHDETTTPLPTKYLSNLNDNNQPLIIPFDTWIRCVVYADYINNKVVYEIPSLEISITDDFFIDVPYPTNIENHLTESFHAVTFHVEINDIELPTYKLDNLEVTALPSLSTEKILSNQFNLYPNPATDLVTITNQENKAIEQIKIYDLTGKLIEIQNFENKAEIQLIVEKIASGTYLLHIQTNEDIAIIKKLIIH